MNTPLDPDQQEATAAEEQPMTDAAPASTIEDEDSLDLGPGPDSELLIDDNLLPVV